MFLGGFIDDRAAEEGNSVSSRCHCRVFHVYGVIPYNKLMATAIKKESRKVERVEARLNPEQKRRIEYAASLNGTSISDFMVSSADQAAVSAIQQHEVWVLTGRDREAVVEALLHPPSPSARMKAAVRRYRRRVKSL